jgi:acetyl esterase
MPHNPYASPLKASDLSGLPPTLLMTTEFDPLRDEGDAFAEKLARHGVSVTHRRYDGMIHGFLRLSLFSERARDAFTEIGRWLRALP